MAGSSNDPPSLPCPRCESTNTKFCYYNNYNLSQPRHFCKSCRQYWTQSGSLRNVPVGGGSRKSSSSSAALSSSKRYRSSTSSALTTTNIDSPVSSTNTTTSSSSNSADPCFNSAPEAAENSAEFTNLKEIRPPVPSETEFPIPIANGSGSRSFISLLNNQNGVVGGGGVGYQTGFFLGFYDMGLTLPTNPAAARISWPYYTTPTNPTTVDYLGAGDFDGCGGAGTTWQQQGDAENLNGGGGGGAAYVDAEEFAWPSFVIPSPAKGLMK